MFQPSHEIAYGDGWTSAATAMVSPFASAASNAYEYVTGSDPVDDAWAAAKSIYEDEPAAPATTPTTAPPGEEPSSMPAWLLPAGVAVAVGAALVGTYAYTNRPGSDW